MDLFPEMACDRQFLGWDKPLLPTAAAYFLSGHRDGTALDLGDWVVALPTTQSVLRFSQLIRSLAVQHGLDYTPARLVTSGDLAETLYQPERPIAIEFEQTLAWARVLRAQPPTELRPLLPVLPDTESLGPWLELAGILRRLASDLATHSVSFDDVLEASDTDAEKARWSLLNQLHERYLGELKKAELSDPHEQRRWAVQKRRVRSKRSIALVGTSDLNESVAKVVMESNRDVIALIAAPESQQYRFDSLGRIRTESFSDFELPLRDDQLVSAAGIGDQAEAVTELVTQLSSQFERSKIVVGVTDHSHVAPVELQLEGCDFAGYRQEGWTVAATAVGRLLGLAATLVADPTWHSLAAFVRHGDVFRVLQDRSAERCEDQTVPPLLVQLDQLLANHLPVNLSDPLPAQAVKAFPLAVQLRDEVRQLLSPFIGNVIKQAKPVKQRSDSGDGWPRLVHSQTIAKWCDGLLQWLDSIYTKQFAEAAGGVDRHLSTEAANKVRELLVRFAALSDQLDVPVTAASALETITGRLVDLRVTYDRQPDQIGIHGWLDLPLDDAPAMVVLGLNHPFVPSAVTSDPFLPGALRARLRISDNDRRYARDVYAMQLLLSTRKEIYFIVGKNSADGSPTPPSRLLAAAPKEATARRVRSLLGSKRDTLPVAHNWSGNLKQSDLPIPMVSVSQCPVDVMSVTAFKTYLDCPYRFYLRHVLGLKPMDDLGTELAANQFGDLIHGAVEDFGRSEANGETDEKHIYEALRHHLHHYAKKHYGEHVQSAVRLQIRQAERRLQHVAVEQAKRAERGWIIHATEAQSNDAAITVDGKKMKLRGRFDRIDHHPAEDRWAILDYKTHGHKPEKKHLKKNPESDELEWVDLQLPLYQLMVPFLGIEAAPHEVQLGYFNVSDKPEETKVNLLEVSDSLMENAKALIEECVRRIFACDFAPTDGRVLYDDYEMILQTGSASRMMQQTVADGGGEVE